MFCSNVRGILISTSLAFFYWGFFAHKQINSLAVFTLHPDMIRFYKNHIHYISEHSVDADKRRYTDTAEAARHYLDADRYGSSPFDSLPQSWEDAKLKYSEAVLLKNGIIPWQIARTYYSLVRAFRERDSIGILRYSADIGHYVSDAHVPLHLTENYNGQLSNQQGIHAFWESRLPELFSKEYDFITGRAKYLENPLTEAWKIAIHASTLTDSVLIIEARISKLFPSDKKFEFSERNGIIVKQYSEEYARTYHSALNGMVELQMRNSIWMTGSFWYSAWVDAGQPVLKNFPQRNEHPEDSDKALREEAMYRKGIILGREEN